jgi:hypothetical protein
MVYNDTTVSPVKVPASAPEYKPTRSKEIAFRYTPPADSIIIATASKLPKHKNVNEQIKKYKDMEDTGRKIWSLGTYTTLGSIVGSAVAGATAVVVGGPATIAAAILLTGCFLGSVVVVVGRMMVDIAVDKSPLNPKYKK